MAPATHAAWYVRVEDPILVAGSKLLAKRPGFIPYDGDPNASDESIREYVRSGRNLPTKALPVPSDSGTVDLNDATLEELHEHALNEFGVKLGNVTVEEARAEILRLAAADEPPAPPQGAADGAPDGAPPKKGLK